MHLLESSYKEVPSKVTLQARTLGVSQTINHIMGGHQKASTFLGHHTGKLLRSSYRQVPSEVTIQTNTAKHLLGSQFSKAPSEAIIHANTCFHLGSSNKKAHSWVTTRASIFLRNNTGKKVSLGVIIQKSIFFGH